ncbi:MAG: hypothetical protein JWQ89_1874 [Devosia sp.]|uniref:hypothetical protein n=1 Tax=Devosia sp. TaxID=1871048 RepID=UPI0026249640|nr:hypothetical protein [Devosia sp.]MDB5540147.1 hypothetical protein [Devosia sp.]
MSEDPQKPESPFRLNRSRILLLVLGALLLVYIISAMLGGVGNFQRLKEAATSPTITAPNP